MTTERSLTSMCVRILSCMRVWEGVSPREREFMTCWLTEYFCPFSGSFDCFCILSLWLPNYLQHCVLIFLSDILLLPLNAVKKKDVGSGTVQYRAVIPSKHWILTGISATWQLNTVSKRTYSVPICLIIFGGKGFLQDSMIIKSGGLG